jgi:hypothetical protein
VGQGRVGLLAPPCTAANKAASNPSTSSCRHDQGDAGSKNTISGLRAQRRQPLVDGWPRPSAQPIVARSPIEAAGAGQFGNLHKEALKLHDRKVQKWERLPPGLARERRRGRGRSSNGPW